MLGGLLISLVTGYLAGGIVLALGFGWPWAVLSHVVVGAGTILWLGWAGNLPSGEP